eukprot:1144443-Prorocentrum_lima.AAC.1
MNQAIAEGQAHLHNRLAALMEDILSPYSQQASITQVLGYAVMTASSKTMRTPYSQGPSASDAPQGTIVG